MRRRDRVTPRSRVLVVSDGSGEHRLRRRGTRELLRDVPVSRASGWSRRRSREVENQAAHLDLGVAVRIGQAVEEAGDGAVRPLVAAPQGGARPGPGLREVPAVGPAPATEMRRLREPTDWAPATGGPGDARRAYAARYRPVPRAEITSGATHNAGPPKRSPTHSEGLPARGRD